MKEKDMPFDRTKHALYTGNVKKCVQNILRRTYDEKTADNFWEAVQLQYCAFLKDEPALGHLQNPVSVYDPILIFAMYKVIPEKPALSDIQQDVFNSFFGPFNTLGKFIDLNRKPDNRLAGMIFRKAYDTRCREIRDFPGSFRMDSFSYDRENGIVRYGFSQCPNAEFAKRHHMEDVLPVMCNCDHIAMRKLHACLIREGTCITSERCDYCIVGDRHPLAQEYDLVKKPNGLLVSVRKERQ